MKTYFLALILTCLSIITQIFLLGSLPDEPPEEDETDQISLVNFETLESCL